MPALRITKSWNPSIAGTPRILHDAHPAARAAVVERQLLEQDDAVRQALQLQVAAARGEVVEQQHRAVAAGEELLERENLAAVAQRLARQQPHLRQRVEDDARAA